MNIPKCIFPKCIYNWVNLKNPGYIQHANEKKLTDFYGYWKLAGIQCCILKTKQQSKESLPLFWCEDPESCDKKVSGEPLEEEFWYGEG